MARPIRWFITCTAFAAAKDTHERLTLEAATTAQTETQSLAPLAALPLASGFPLWAERLFPHSQSGLAPIVVSSG